MAFARLSTYKIPRRYLSGVGWTMGGQIAMLPLKLVRFVLLARLLGVEQYGVLMTGTALVLFVSAFAGWGYNFVLAKNVARSNDTFREWWGNGVVVIVATGLPFALGLAMVGPHLLPGSSWFLLAALAGADLIFNKFSELAEQAYRAHWKMVQAAILTFAPEAARLIALVPLLATDSANAAAYALWQLVGVGVVGVIAASVTSRQLGPPEPNVSSIRESFGIATHFAIGQSVGHVYNTVDRVMLGRLATFEAVGVYSAAFNLVGMANLPANALRRAMTARYFELGGIGVNRTLKFAVQNVAIGLAYALPISTVIYLVAPALPLLLGDGYSSSISAIRWMAVIPVLYVLTDTAGMALHAIDRPQDRTLVFVVIALINVGLNIWLIPEFSWKGAIWAMLLSESMLAMGLWLALVARAIRERASIG